MLDSHPKFRETGMFHIHNIGMTEKFNYGDCGPSKITATANSLFFYGREYGIPEYGLLQRDSPDAADPLSMLWYESSLKGEWHDHLPLDKAFSDPSGAWVSLRSSWTDSNGVFVAMKGGKMTGHATRKATLHPGSNILMCYSCHPELQSFVLPSQFGHPSCILSQVAEKIYRIPGSVFWLLIFRQAV